MKWDNDQISVFKTDPYKVHNIECTTNKKVAGFILFTILVPFPSPPT